MSEAKVRRLLRWYPRVWRERYGEEYAELLLAEIDEQPRDWRRDVDVRWHGLKSRLAAAGIGASPLRDAKTTRAAGAVAMAVFLTGSTSLWGQTLAGSSSAPSAHPAITAIRFGFAACLGTLAVFALSRSALLLREVRRHQAMRKRIAPALLATGLGVTTYLGGLVVVWSHLRWGVTPSAVLTAMAMPVNAYWAHPHLLVHLYDRTTLAWMALSPLAVATMIGGVLAAGRAVPERPPADSRRVVSLLPTALLVPVLAASTWWVVSSQHYGSPGLRAGTPDYALIIAMTASLVVLSSARRAQRDLRAA